MIRVLIELVGGPADGIVYALEEYKPFLEFPIEPDRTRQIVQFEAENAGPVQIDSEYITLSVARYEPTGKYTRERWWIYEYVANEKDTSK